MGLIRQKLHSGRGASILLALAFFLLCGFVGAVILGSATANAQKVQDRRADRQAYYAVSSAARLLRDTLGDSVCQGREQLVQYGCGYIHENEGPHLRGQADFMGTTGGNLLTEAAWKVYCSQTQFSHGSIEKVALPYQVRFTVEAGEGLPTVEGTMTMDRDYHAAIVLAAGAEGRHPMTLTFRALVQQEDQTDANQPTCSHADDTDEEGNPVWVSYTGTTRTITTAVSWPTAEIAKGGVGGPAGEEAPHG